MLRGILALLTFGVLFLSCDLVQRTVVAPLARRRSSRERLLTAWKRRLGRITMWTLRHIAGADIRIEVSLPARPDVLVLMNHQSLLDIPIAVESFASGWPKIVTRRRYARGIPLVSHMLRLYEHPLVDPGRNARTQLVELRELARSGEHPLVLFPEGSRTRDGEVRPFRPAGLGAILGARRWSVYVVTLDGLWRTARLKDFAQTVGDIRCRVTGRGPYAFDPEHDDAEAFAQCMYEEMREGLRELRGEPSPHEVGSP